MYLSKLELHGFKSFAERTVLHFDPGITAIVGPNGCGKSNIVDAVRWVIGEQRARILRSEKMENVIFNGTSKRRALGMSEVLLTIQNTRNILPTEYGEVTIGRRLYRSGDSEYLLNGVQCRLKDITDLFMDTGMGAGAYSVIELKMVDEILSENAQDRRRLFEEAAGITRYKLRRKQTLSKLETTQVDLDRVRDLTEEVGKQVRSLKRQAEKAGRFKEYSVRLRALELTLAQLEYDRLSARDAELTSLVEDLRGQIDALAAAEREQDEALEAGRSALEAAESALEQARQALAEHIDSVRKLETEQRLTLERLDGAYRDTERMRREEEIDAERLASLERDLSTNTAALEAAAPERQAAEERLAELEKERDATQAELSRRRTLVDSLRRTERKIEEERSAEIRRFDRMVNRKEFLESERNRLQQELSSFASDRGTIERRAQDAYKLFEEARAVRDSSITSLNAAETTRNEKKAALDEIIARVRELEKRREGLAAEVHLLENLVSSFEEFPDAVRFLAEDSSWLNAPIVTVSDVLSCAPDYRVALDTALGELASCIIVGDDDELGAAARRLRQKDKGRATFIVLDRLSVDVDVAAPDDSLLAHVSVSDGVYAPLARLLLQDVAVVDSLEEVTNKAGDRVVTKDGEWIEGGGIVHTGGEGTPPSALTGRMERRDQLEQSRLELDEIDSQIRAAKGRQEEAAKALEEVPVEALREELQKAEKALSEAEREEARAAFELETMQQRLNEQTEREATLSAEIESIAAGISEETAALDSLKRRHAEVVSERSRSEASLTEAEEAASSASRHYNEAHVTAIQERNRLENLQREAERIEAARKNIQARKAERRRHQQSLSEQIASWQSELDELKKSSEAIAENRNPLEEAVGDRMTSVSAAREAIAEIELQLKQLRQDREQKISLENQHAVSRAEVNTRLEDLVESILTDFEIRLGEDDIEVEDVEEADAREEVARLRLQVRSLGAVNELALESYEEESERLEFLEEQQRDLEQAEETLIETIDELNTTASARFEETYAAIQLSFGKIFTDLFGGDASAQLVLEDPSDPLESPIEIRARPRGKRPSTIAQLSGGEKTLTAIALLFAIYLVKPSPFCILDEVDAPLDDANIERFMSLIRSFSTETQFILVTHNKRTMEAADRLYGITMQEQGVSKLVGVKFEEAAELVD